MLRLNSGFVVDGSAKASKEGRATGLPPFRIAAAALLAASLAACGGGGGGTAASPEQAQGSPSGNGNGSDSGASNGSGGSSGSGGGVVAAPTGTAAGSFLFVPGSAVSTSEGLASATGGTLFASWNPSDATNSMRPGMKVTFFGAASGCDGARNGSLGEGDAARFDANATLTGVVSPDGSPMRWTPLGNNASCDLASQGASGDSLVHLQAADGGAVGMLTATGPRTDGTPTFFGAFGDAGQNGVGANADIAGSFVAFRQDWKGSAPLMPWAATGTTRVYTVQSIASTAGATGALGAKPIQAKQEILASFINVDCMKQLAGVHPCQLQYDISTAIYRTGVTDWNTVGWFNAGKVWFDAAQGGTPVVEGPIKASGSDTTDGASGLSLFTSHGAPTQHTVFASAAFDISIDFAQLLNALKLTTAQALSKDVTAVSDDDMAAFWGATWNQQAAWATLSGSVGQEIYNPFADHHVYVGGSFKAFYIGPSA